MSMSSATSLSRFRSGADGNFQTRLDLCRHSQGAHREGTEGRQDRAARPGAAARSARDRGRDRHRGTDGRRAVPEGARRKRRRGRRGERAARTTPRPRRRWRSAPASIRRWPGTWARSWSAVRSAPSRSAQRHGLPAPRSFRDRAAQSCRALHDGVGRGPHALRKTHPFLLAGPGGNARPLAMQVRAGDRPPRARIGQPLHAVPIPIR